MPASDQRRPVVAGLMEEGPQGPQLLAARCVGCGAVYFPRVATCRNPDCDAEGMEAIALSRSGTLYSYTIQHYQPPPLFRMDDWRPYAIGLVELPEGIRVMGMLAGVAPDDIRIGDTYVLGSARLFIDEEDCEVRTHVFEPAAGGNVS